MADSELGVALEKLVDGSSVSSVLEALAEVCAEKAEHIRSNWQDEALAKQWSAAQRLIDAVIVKVAV